MSQKSGTPKMSSERIVKTSAEQRASNIQPRRKSALCWTVAERTTILRAHRAQTERRRHRGEGRE